MCHDGIQRTANQQVVLAILVKDDVTSGAGGFGKVVDQLFLPEGEFVPAVHAVAHDFDVGEAVHHELEGVVGEILRPLALLLGAGGEEQKGSHKQDCFFQETHL